MFARSAGKLSIMGFSHDPAGLLRDAAAVNYILGLDDGKNVTSMLAGDEQSSSLCNTL